MDDMDLPGEGVSVIAGRANWSTGYVQAELYKQLLEELGYEVSDPAELELGPNKAYMVMANGWMDYWPNSWYPGHLAWLAGELPDGSLVGDHVSVVGEEMIAGGLQGFLVTKSFADEFGVYTLNALNDNAEALAAFDATDPVPGNGMADIFGCPESWTCDNIITNQIAFSGLDNIQQTIAGYDAMFAQAVDNANEGVPMVAYTWTPSAYITQLRPGDNVYWIGLNEILDDSNPANQEGGEEHSQRGADGNGGYAAIGPDQCPAAAEHPDGLCPIGWIAADILVTANNDFLAANPAAKKLFEIVKLSVIDVSLANVEQDDGASPTDLATQWIADNRGLVDEWLTQAMAAGNVRQQRETPPTTTTLASRENARRYLVPTYFCMPKGTYSARLMQNIVTDLHAHVNAFYMRESSGLADVRLDWAGSVSPPIDWSRSTFDRYYNDDKDDPCETYAVNAAGGTRQILVLVALPSETYAGWAWFGVGPAMAALSGEENLDEDSPNRVRLHATVAHELGHSLFGWEHTDDPDIQAVDCGAIHRSLMTSGSDCYVEGADPLDTYRVVCELRLEQEWPCSLTSAIAGNVPVSHDVWVSFWNDEDHISRGVWTSSIRQVLPHSAEEPVAELAILCGYSDQLAAWELDLVVDWGLPFVQKNSDANEDNLSARFEDQTLLELPVNLSSDQTAHFVGEFRNEQWNNAAGRRLIQTLVAKSGQTVTLFARDNSNRLFQATFDTDGAKVAVQSTINFCHSEPQ